MTRGKLNQDLLTLWQQNRWTVVFVTHNIYEAVYLSNRVVVMAPDPAELWQTFPSMPPIPARRSFAHRLSLVTIAEGYRHLWPGSRRGEIDAVNPVQDGGVEEGKEDPVIWGRMEVLRKVKRIR